MTSSERMEKLCALSIISYTFVHEFLMLMEKIPTTKIETAGVTVQGTKFLLYYNPDFFDRLTDAEAFYVLTHEIYHLALHHCTRTKFDNMEVAGIAADLAVNELIPEESNIIARPRALGGDTIGTFVDDFEKEPRFQGIEHKQTAEWYYDFIISKAPKIKVISSGGSGKNQNSGSPTDKDKSVEKMDDHSGWDKTNEIADEIIKAKVEEIIRANKWGNTTADVIETIKAAQKSRINWRRHIRKWGGNVAWRERQQTVKRPNRRTGFVHPGHKRLHVDKVLLGVDASASVEAPGLAQFLTEMNYISELVPVDVVVFDEAIKCTPKPFKKKKTFDFKGRGGTNFQPLMDLVKEKKYKAVIILTDGQAPAPDRPNARVLWAIIGAANQPPVDWGDRVWIKNH